MSSQRGQRSSWAGYDGCSAGRVPMGTNVFTGGRKPTKMTGSSSGLSQT